MVSLRNNIFFCALFILSVCIMVSLLSGPILRVMTNEAFLSAERFIPWLMFGFAFWALTTMHMPFFIHNNKQKCIAVIAPIGAVINLILNFFTSKYVGAIGVAIAFFISNFMNFLMIFFSVRRFTPLPMIPDFKGIYHMVKNLKK